jgi:hypothetical protein
MQKTELKPQIHHNSLREGDLNKIMTIQKAANRLQKGCKIRGFLQNPKQTPSKI